MTKNQNIFTCTNCGAQYSKWQGRCLECGKWSTIVEEEKKDTKINTSVKPDSPIILSELKNDAHFRIKTNIEELDRVLGGGIVKGSLILLGGDPGIGKSTLALQIAQSITNTLYISGEESANQVKIRADRLNLQSTKLNFLAQTDIDKITATAIALKPSLVIIDSIQTITSDEASSGPGTIAQITSCAGKLIALAKNYDIPVIIIGHVTKDGLVAGPKTLEHLVDAVLYLENDNQNYYKILRGTKNRFGSTGEIGIFEMSSQGLVEVKNPTEIFIEGQDSNHPGRAMSAIIEGTRPFLVEIQALVSKTVFGYPQRKSSGYDLNRLQMIIAVISKIAKVNLSNQDIYLNIAGGIKTKDTAVDLAVALAIISAFYDIIIDHKCLIIGEIGLSGEVRNIPQLDKRINEGKKLKFTKIITPQSKGNKDNLIVQINDIKEAIKIINTTPDGK
ncbi:MAG: DNA repair protein RadA [Candidatus Buchananbacteria bacterium]